VIGDFSTIGGLTISTTSLPDIPVPAGTVCLTSATSPDLNERRRLVRALIFEGFHVFLAESK
jgi:hypothetical protein